VETAGPGDLPAIAHLFGELARHHGRIQPDNPRYGVPSTRWRELAARALEDPDEEVLVARSGDEVVGFVRFLYREKPWGISCEIETLVVDEDWRGAGVGTRLLEVAEAAAVAKGARGIRADILVGNDEGAAFWESRGYKGFALRFGKALGEE
jgi:ribosomal protein S18 acetylase RimI-like enzyme